MATSVTVNMLSNHSVAQRSLSMVQPLDMQLLPTRRGCLAFAWIVIITPGQTYARYYANSLTLWMIACHFPHLCSSLVQLTSAETPCMFALAEVCSITVIGARAE